MPHSSTPRSTSRNRLSAPRVYPGARFSARLSARGLSQEPRAGVPGRLWDPTLLDRLVQPLSRIRE